MQKKAIWENGTNYIDSFNFTEIQSKPVLKQKFKKLILATVILVAGIIFVTSVQEKVRNIQHDQKRGGGEHRIGVYKIQKRLQTFQKVTKEKFGNRKVTNLTKTMNRISLSTFTLNFHSKLVPGGVPPSSCKKSQQFN